MNEKLSLERDRQNTTLILFDGRSSLQRAQPILVGGAFYVRKRIFAPGNPFVHRRTAAAEDANMFTEFERKATECQNLFKRHA